MSVTRRMESQRGRIGKEIKSGLDKNNRPWANFSFAVDINQRDEQGNWEKVDTAWYQVSAFGALAKNVTESLRPGVPVVVTGDLEQQVRVVQGDDGAPVAQTRDEVRASMVSPDLILTSVVVPERPSRQGPTQAGPDAAAQVQQSPVQSQPAVDTGIRQSPGQEHDAAGSAYGPATSAPREVGGAQAPGPDAGGAGGPDSIWPPAVQPGTGSAGLR